MSEDCSGYKVKKRRPTYKWIQMQLAWKLPACFSIAEVVCRKKNQVLDAVAEKSGVRQEARVFELRN